MLFSKQIKNKKRREDCERCEEMFLTASYEYVDAMAGVIWMSDESKSALLLKMGRYQALLRVFRK